MIFEKILSIKVLFGHKMKKKRLKDYKKFECISVWEKINLKSTYNNKIKYLSL